MQYSCVGFIKPTAIAYIFNKQFSRTLPSVFVFYCQKFCLSNWFFFFFSYFVAPFVVFHDAHYNNNAITCAYTRPKLIFRNKILPKRIRCAATGGKPFQYNNTLLRFAHIGIRRGPGLKYVRRIYIFVATKMFGATK